MAINRKMVVGFVIWFLISATLCTIMWFAPMSKLKYEMPNGIMCEGSRITGGGFGGATNEFYACSDGKTYINPETYTKFKNKNVRTLGDAILGVNE